MNKAKKNAGLLIVSALIVGSIVYLEQHKEKLPPSTSAEDVVIQTPGPAKPLAPNEAQVRALSLAAKAKKISQSERDC